MKDFNEKVIDTLTDQLIKGYQIQDQYGGTREVESPLQTIVRRHMTDNHDFFSKEVAKILGSKAIKEAISEYINQQLGSEYSLKSFQKKFIEQFKTEIEEEVVKDLRVLLSGKKLTIAIEE